MIHALDADHIMAIAGLSQGQRFRRKALGFCCRWAIGHGTTLLLLGFMVYYLGQTLPAAFSLWAETLVGLLLVAIGLLVLWRLQQRGKPAHGKNTDYQRQHTPTLVGILHGAAGSAPILALIPLSQATSVSLALSYLVLFGLGTFFAMMAFGGILGHLFKHMRNHNLRTQRLVLSCIAGCTLGLGVLMLMELWT